MKIVFLHGIGDGDREGDWLVGLNRGLDRIGKLPVGESQIIAPRYASYLKTDGIAAKVPGSTYKPKDDSAARQEFERRQARVQRLLRINPAVRGFGFDMIPDFIWNNLPPLVIESSKIADAFNFAQVRRYIRTDSLRGAIMTRILEDLPTKGEIVLIAHSLGSVIAIDLLDHLPESLHVRRFITLGSPANMKALHSGSERLLKKFPYSRVDDWSNFINRMDYVTGGRGLAGVFPGAQDFVLAEVSGHKASKYLEDVAVAGLVSDVLHPRKDVVPASSDIAVRLTDAEARVLLVQHFAEAVSCRIKDGDARQRYSSALQILRDDLASQIQQLMSSGGPIASELRELAAGRLPVLPHRWDLHEAVAQMVVLAVLNCVAPYEIEVGNAQKLALPDIARQLGFRSDIGTAVRQALDEVERCIRGSKFPWGRILAGAGLALIAAGPVGLVAVGPAAAFGAAAVGGLGAGALAGAGAAPAPVAAVARAQSGDNAPTLTRMVLRVATEHARKLLQLPHEAALWYELTDFELQVSAAIRRLEPFSDKKSQKLQHLSEIQQAVQVLLEFMTTKGLSPTEITEDESQGQ